MVINAKKVKKKIDLTISFFVGLIITISIICFAFGFALFVTSLMKMLESDNPLISLFIGICLMTIPVILGIWRIEHVKNKILENFSRLKLD